MRHNTTATVSPSACSKTTGRAVFSPGFVIFCLACVQAAFLVPYVVLHPGDRTNLFTAIVVTLPALWLAGLRWRQAITWPTVLPWLFLACGLGFSAWASPAPVPATLRAAAFFLPAASALFCAHELFQHETTRVCFFRFLTFCFAGLTSAHLLFGCSPSFLGLHHHALAGALILLAAGPIHLALTGSRPWRAGAIFLLSLGYLVSFLAGSRFIILLPFVLVPALMLVGHISLRWAGLGIVVSSGIAMIFFAVYPEKIMRYANYESTFYRVEGVPAALHIIKQRPLLGIGIRTQRRDYLETFEPPFGSVTKERFLAVVDYNVTSDNQYLSLPVGIGLPLALLYFFLLARNLWAYFRRTRSKELDQGAQVAITFALLATLIHFFVYDGLFYPQINWFFHVLLGIGVYATAQASTMPPAPIS